jgi:hypothetical protein
MRAALKLFLIIALVVAPAAQGFAQQTSPPPQQPGNNTQQEQGQYPTGEYVQPGQSQNPSGNTAQPRQGEAATPPVGVGPDGVPQPGVGNMADSVASRQVPWGWLILGFISGLIIGLAVRPRRTVTYTTTTRPDVDDIRRDRIA